MKLVNIYILFFFKQKPHFFSFVLLAYFKIPARSIQSALISASSLQTLGVH